MCSNSGAQTEAPSGRPRTSDRHILQRAIERGNLVVAEVVARELGGLSLADALELTGLVSLRDRERGARYAVRWLSRFLEEMGPTLDEAVMVASALRAVGGAGHAEAIAFLRAVTTN